MRQTIPILMEDKHIIVIVKPPGMPSQGDRSGAVDVVNGLKGQLALRDKAVPEIYPVHRLDRPVGGVMVYARTKQAAARLSEQVRKHELKKWYYAAAEGEFPETIGETPVRAEDYLARQQGNLSRIVTVSDPSGKKAELLYRGIAVQDGLTLLEIELLTGRHHQIRVQLAARGMGLAGDTKYNPGTGWSGQLGLWACRLELRHPENKKRLVLEQEPGGKIFQRFFMS